MPGQLIVTTLRFQNVVKCEFSNGHTVWLSWHLRIPLELLLHEERGASPGGVEEVNI